MLQRNERLSSAEYQTIYGALRGVPMSRAMEAEVLSIVRQAHAHLDDIDGCTDQLLDLFARHEREANSISVWRFEAAPKELQDVSRGGDEDWLAEIPPEYVSEYAPWLEEPAFGCCAVDEYPHPSKPNWVVRIGSHA